MLTPYIILFSKEGWEMFRKREKLCSVNPILYTQWFKENRVKFVSTYRYTQTVAVEFLTEEDLVAFKLKYL